MIARKSALIILNTVVGAVLGLLALKAIGTWMDPDIIGRAAYPLGILGILVFVTDMGFGQAHVKRVSEGVDEGDCFATFAVFKAVTTGAFVVVALLVVYVREVVMGVGAEDIAISAYVFLIGYYALQSMRSLFIGTFEARREIARVELSRFAETLARVVVTLAVAAVFAAVAFQPARGPLAGLATADVALFRLVAHYPSGAFAFAFLAGSAVSIAVAYREWHRIGRVIGRFRWDILNGYWQFALPIFLMSIVGTVAGHLDRTALGYFGGSVDVGVYELPKRFTTLLEAIPVAVGVLLFPTISAMHATGARERIRTTTETALRFISMLVLPITVFVMLFPQPLISIFIDDKFQGGAVAMSLLAAYAFIIGLTRPYFSLFAGVGRTDVTAKVGGLMAVSNIVLNVLLIPDDIKSLGITLGGLGVTGAALATLISGVVGYATMAYAARRLDVYVRPVGFARHAVGSTVMALVLAALHWGGIHPFVRWYDFGLYTLVGGLVYVGTLAALREFTKRDLEFFLRIANVREMMRYVRSEIFRR